MPPEHARVFGEGGSSSLNPICLLLMLIGAILVFVLPRQKIIVPWLFVSLFVPDWQALTIGGAHLYVCRILVLAGLIRLIASGDQVFSGGYGRIDKSFIWMNVCEMVATVLLFREFSAFTNQIACGLDSIGSYIVLRYAIRAEQEASRALKCMAALTIIFSACMIVEQKKMFNPFSLIGGYASVPEVREGKVRSQGVFAHSLLAGTFGATLLPMFIWLWRTGKSALFGFVGCVGATIMTLTANSSTPLLAYVSGIFAICLWPIRKQMRAVRWAIVIGLLVLSLVMKAPVWFIIAHVDLTGSSSSYHRAIIIDAFIRHFSDWWLIGVKETGSWGWDLWDTQNQYVNVGQTGGLCAFILFLVLITRCFKKIGEARKRVDGDKRLEWSAWLLGAALFAHIVGFFGVNYFDESRVNWQMLIAVIVASTVPTLTSKVGQLSPASSQFQQPASSDDWFGVFR